MNDVTIEVVEQDETVYIEIIENDESVVVEAIESNDIVNITVSDVLEPDPTVFGNPDTDYAAIFLIFLNT